MAFPLHLEHGIPLDGQPDNFCEMGASAQRSQSPLGTLAKTGMLNGEKYHIRTGQHVRHT